MGEIKKVEKRKKRLEEAEKFLASYEKEADRRGLVEVIVRFCKEYDVLSYKDKMLGTDSCCELLVELDETVLRNTFIFHSFP